MAQQECSTKQEAGRNAAPPAGRQAGGQAGGRERWVTRAGFLFYCGAMVMPTRMGEGGRENKGNAEGSASSEEPGHVGRRMGGLAE